MAVPRDLLRAHGCAALRGPDQVRERPPRPPGRTCNGLQHYAALGGDFKGAHQVNLDIGDRPADVYSGVADMVNELIERDAENNVQEAVLLKGRVTRKVVKQTVRALLLLLARKLSLLTLLTRALDRS